MTLCCACDTPSHPSIGTLTPQTATITEATSAATPRLMLDCDLYDFRLSFPIWGCGPDRKPTDVSAAPCAFLIVF